MKYQGAGGCWWVLVGAGGWQGIRQPLSSSHWLLLLWGCLTLKVLA